MKANYSLPNDLQSHQPKLNFHVNSLASSPGLLQSATKTACSAHGDARDLPKDVDTQSGPNEEPLLLPEVAMSSHKASPKNGKERLEAEI
jgi:hypothetical protein